MDGTSKTFASRPASESCASASARVSPTSDGTSTSPVPLETFRRTPSSGDTRSPDPGFRAITVPSGLSEKTSNTRTSRLSLASRSRASCSGSPTAFGTTTGRPGRREDRHGGSLLQLRACSRTLLEHRAARCSVRPVDDVRLEAFLLEPRHGGVERLRGYRRDGLLFTAREVPESTEPDEGGQQEECESGPEVVERPSPRASLDPLALVLHLSVRADGEPLLFHRDRFARGSVTRPWIDERLGWRARQVLAPLRRRAGRAAANYGRLFLVRAVATGGTYPSQAILETLARSARQERTSPKMIECMSGVTRQESVLWCAVSRGRETSAGACIASCGDLWKDVG